VQEVFGADMKNMGLANCFRSPLRTSTTSKVYLTPSARRRIAEVKRDAPRAGHAQGMPPSSQREPARKVKRLKFVAETKIAEAQKNYAVQKVAYDAEC